MGANFEQVFEVKIAPTQAERGRLGMRVSFEQIFESEMRSTQAGGGKAGECG